MFKIYDRIIGEDYPPYIIAELSANHNGTIDRAKQSIKIAKECGVSAVKIQSYNADTMTIDCDKEDFLIKSGLWKGYKLYDLYQEASTPFSWHKELFSYAKDIGVTIFSTPFDESAVELLESLNTPAYKIASFELTDLPLIKYVAKKGKPMLMSTGMASELEIEEAVDAARSSGCSSLLLFHCISSYPTPIEQINLRKILSLKSKFGILIGLSDHTLTNTASIGSIALGACAIEKHFTISRDEIGPDSTFSIEPDELRDLIISTKDAWMSLGNGGYERAAVECESKIFRRSLYYVTNIKAGEIIRDTDVKRIRPGYGLAPKYIEDIVGRIAKFDIDRGDPVTWESIL